MSEKVKLPVNGWDITVFGDNMIVIPANSIPFYEGNIVLPDSVTDNPLTSTLRRGDHKGKETHCLVVKTSDEANTRFTDRFPEGTRVAVQGTLIPMNVNGKCYFICRMIDVVAVLKRSDGSPDPEWLKLKKEYIDKDFEITE